MIRNDTTGKNSKDSKMFTNNRTIDLLIVGGIIGVVLSIFFFMLGVPFGFVILFNGIIGGIIGWFWDDIYYIFTGKDHE